MSSKVQVIKEIRAEQEMATGVRPTKAEAEELWVKEVADFQASIEQTGMRTAAIAFPRCAEYFRNWWVGAEYPQGRELRQVLKDIAAGRPPAEPHDPDKILADFGAHPAQPERPVVDESAPDDGTLLAEMEAERDRQLAEESDEVPGHDFGVEQRRSSTRLACSCGATSRWSRDEHRVGEWVNAHRAEVMATV